MANESLKREHRIDSSDSARPPATLEAQTQHYAQGLKPKPRVIVDTNYEELDSTVPRGKNQPVAQLILKTTTYDDGTTVDTTVGEDNEGYQQFLRGITAESKQTGATRQHTPKKKPAAPVRNPASKKG